MSEAKFTPGPWVFSRKFVVGPLDKEDGQSFCMVVGVADVYGENRSADANLIAAAPELYEALEDVLGLIPLEFEESPMVAFAKAALAKARG